MLRPLALVLLSLIAAAAAGCRPARVPDRGETTATRRLPAGGLVAPEEVAGWMARPDPPLLLDVRSVGEYRAGHLPGAVNVPVQELGRRLAELERGREAGVIVYCHSGGRTRAALKILAQAGFTDTAQLAGDFQRWQRERRPLVRP